MWRDIGVVLLLASATLMIAYAQDGDVKKSLNITVPRWIENGTNEEVILDCDYDYSLDEEKFIIKWYLNTGTEAIYQWIPSQNSRWFSTKFSPYADWEYHLKPSDKYTKYRRIVLIRPTIEFRGIYQCVVDSSLGYGVAEARMDVYAPAKNITITYRTLQNNEVNLTCVVKKIFPKPEIQLFAISSDSDVPRPIGETSAYIKDNGIHGFDITVTAIIPMYQLNSSSDTTLRCVVLIPESPYQEEREQAYHPSNEMAILEPEHEKRNKPPSSSNNVSASFICIIFAILVL